MGGGTGTGVAPYLAKLAKEIYGDDLLVVGVVTRPFNFEGYVREKQADEGIKEMQKHVDSMIIVPNEKLFANIDPETSSRDAFQMVDEVLLQAVKGISEVITQPGEVNIDFNDIRKVMCHSQNRSSALARPAARGGICRPSKRPFPRRFWKARTSAARKGLSCIFRGRKFNAFGTGRGDESHPPVRQQRFHHYVRPFVRFRLKRNV